jgi:hypothetical protein
MILGRATTLWIALIGAVLNVAVLVFNVGLTAIQIGAIDGLGLVIIGIIANSEVTGSALGRGARLTGSLFGRKS